MEQTDLKKAAAEAALTYIEDDSIVGVGTGSTVNYLIEALAKIKHRIQGAVASSLETERLLKQYRIPILTLTQVDNLPLYIDGTDEVDKHLRLIKGAGGALTREKILATVAKQFICIADVSKQVSMLGKKPLPIEVLPMARSYVARQLVKLGGDPVYRGGVVTDNGNHILDIYNLDFTQPLALEQTLNNQVGIIENGIFAARPADLLLLATKSGVIPLTPK